MKSLNSQNSYSAYCKKLSIEIKKNLLKLKSKNLFFTGSSGFLCGQLINFLSLCNREYNLNLKLYCFSTNLKKLKKKSPEKNIIYSNNLKFFYKKKIDYIFHFASPSSHNSRKSFFLESSIYANIFFLKELKKIRSRNKLIYISTNAIQSNKKKLENEIFMDNNQNINPRTQYDLVKLLGELTVENKIYNDDYYIIRPDLICGPGEDPKSGRYFSDVVNSIRNKKVFNFRGTKKDERSFMFVLDFILSLIKVITSEKKNRRYVIGNISKKTNIFNNLREIQKNFKFLKIKTRKSIFQKGNPSRQKIRLFPYQKKANIICKTNFIKALELTLGKKY